MKNFNLSLVVLALLALTGCATVKPEIVTVEKIRTVFVEPPASFLEDCKVDAPPVAKNYIESDWPTKEALLTVYARSQIFNLNKCNTDKRSLRNWVKEQKQIFQETVKE
jgi:hypothetical protein